MQLIDYCQEENGVSLTGYTDFSVKDTLECGQCFRYEKLGEGEYHIVALGRPLVIRQDESKTLFHKTSTREFEELWIPYFDLNRDYRAVKGTLSANDIVLRDAVEYAGGIHILCQDPWECLVSFIISQNNNIPRIRKITETLAKAYGKPLGGGDYAFPSADALQRLTLDDLLNCKTGFRAKYILDAARNVADGKVDLKAIGGMPTPEARASLISIKGVGGKIADCVLLFAYGRTEVFPTDVWIKRVMEHFYFNGGSASLTEIQKLARARFGEYAGFAQQYLYVYARQFLKN